MIKINTLELENVKRVKAVTLEPSGTGLTVIGGRNNQGKTSVLDAITWCLGGERYKPSEPRREGSMVPPAMKITMNNGLIVERKGKNSELKVIDPSGNKAGQTLLNSFIETLALDLPKFMEATGKEKAKTLLEIIGVGEQLYQLDEKEKELYNKRLYVGQVADQKQKAVDEMEIFPDAPKELISVSELIQQQQAILAQNGENQRKRAMVEELTNKLSEVNRELERLIEIKAALEADLKTANTSATDLQDQSTEDLEKNIADIEEINRRVRVNMDKDIKADEAAKYKAEYADLTLDIEAVRKEKMDLLANANLPLEGLTVEDGELLYKGYKWDNMSGSDQLKVSTAIVRKLNPECGFVLLDKLEQMDIESMKEFGEWLTAEGLQAIATRVSTGDECSVIIEDGYSQAPETNEQPAWKGGF